MKLLPPLALLLLAVSCAPKTAGTGLVQFTLSGFKPPSDAAIEARLVEISAPDRRAIASKEFPVSPFYIIPYPKDAVVSNFRYGVLVRVVRGGRQIAASSEAGPVLTNGHRDQVVVTLIPSPDQQ